MSDERFTKIIADSLLLDRKLFDWGVATGHTTAEEVGLEVRKLAPPERKQKAKELTDAGLSKRQTAKVLGVAEGTVRNDLRNDYAENAESLRKEPNVPENGTQCSTPDAAENGTSVVTPDAEKKSTRELLSQSDQNDWRTPRKYLEAAHATMGGIDLDPATSIAANETVQATLIYTEKEDGLQQPWKGRVWLNPPYGGQARLFVERLIREYQVGNVTAALTLLNSHPTETKWFQQLFDYSICFVRGRIDFGGPSRAVSSTSTHGSAVAYLGKDIDSFRQNFSQFGAIVRKA